MKQLNISSRELNLKFTLDGGQAFRWIENEDFSWTGVFAHRVWFLTQNDRGIYYKTFKAETHILKENDDDEVVLRNYLRADVSLFKLYHTWSEQDTVFAKVCSKFEGIRVLQQDPLETIFSFICSSNNNITRIKSMIEKMCKLYGSLITVIDGKDYYDFPSVYKLAEKNVNNELKAAAFGYRAKYIQKTAEQIIEFGGDSWISYLKNLPYLETKNQLMKLTGVGAKVADCICLMAFNHLDAIPVDTHVYQIAAKYYLPNLKSSKTLSAKIYNEIGDHFRSLYKIHAGWAHCILFCNDLKVYKNETNRKRKGDCIENENIKDNNKKTKR